MAYRIFNDYSKRNTAAFWITISIGTALLICLIYLFINYTIISF